MGRRLQFNLRALLMILGIMATIAASASDSRLTREIAFLFFFYLITLWFVAER
jgi:hypothetical protein